MSDIGKPDATFDLWFDALPDNGEAPYMLAWCAYLHARAESADEIERLRAGVRPEQWDRWYDVSTLDIDLRRKLSFHDLRRLGARAVRAFRESEA